MMENLVEVKTSLIRRLMHLERYQALFELIVGVSKFNISYPGDEEMTDQEEYLWHQAIAHLDFLILFGTDKTQIEQDGKFYFSQAEDFEQWLCEGAIGVTLDELQKYLEHYPM